MGIKHNPADSPCLEETPKLNAVLRREKGCKFLPICTVDEGGAVQDVLLHPRLSRTAPLGASSLLHRFTFRSFTFQIFAFMKNKGCKKNSQVYFYIPYVSSLPINSAQLTSYQSIHSTIQRVQNIQSNVL